MKVLLRRNIYKLGQIGDVVNVKPGYARNYLVPHGLAVQPTPGNLKAVEAEKEAYLAQVAAERQALQARADAVNGKEVTLSARANEEGHLYGSVGPAQIVAALANENLPVEEKNVVLDEPFHTLDKYEVTLAFGHDVTASITVWVVPVRTEDDAEEGAEDDDAETPAEEASEG